MMGMVDVIHLMRQCKCEEIRLFSLFLLTRPPPYPRLSSICLLKLFPRPPGVG